MKVLLVEDARAEVQRYGFEIERAGFELLVAGDVATAQRLASENQVGAALVDMGLPYDIRSTDPEKTAEKPQNGALLLHSLAQMGIPVFALTGSTDPTKSRLIGIYPVIGKPIADFDREVTSRLRALGGTAARAAQPPATNERPPHASALSMHTAEQHAFFVGEALADLAEAYGRNGTCAIHIAPSFRSGLSDIQGVAAQRGDPVKVLVVAAAGLEIDRRCKHLRQLVEPLDSITRFIDPRMVLFGAMTVSDFATIRTLLFSHLVDWLPADLNEAAALQRLDDAWQRDSFKGRLLGLGLASGAPNHVAAHHRTRLKLAEDLHLADLASEPLFRAAVRAASDGAQWDALADTLCSYLTSMIRLDQERWENAFFLDLSMLEKLKASELRDSAALSLLLRFWCALLASTMGGILDMTRKDLAELEAFSMGLRKDFLEGADSDA